MYPLSYSNWLLLFYSSEIYQLLSEKEVRVRVEIKEGE